MFFEAARQKQTTTVGVTSSGFRTHLHLKHTQLAPHFLMLGMPVNPKSITQGVMTNLTELQLVELGKREVRLQCGKRQ